MKVIKSASFYFLFLLVSFGFIAKSLAEKSINNINSEIILNDNCSPLDHDFVMLSKKNNNYKEPWDESRNDIGVFYDFEWDKKYKKIKIKRNKNNYPIVRFSLFDKKNISQGTVVKNFNKKDLSKLSDKEIELIHKSEGKIDLLLGNNKIITMNSNPYKLNNFKLTDLIINSVHNIDTAKGILEISLDAYLTNNRKDLLDIILAHEDKLSEYLEPGYLNPICSALKNEFEWPLESVNFNEYRYDSDVREGLKNKEVTVTSVFDITYNKKSRSLRSLRTEKGIFFIRQDFDFRKFPFDTQNLIITIESGTGSLANHYGGDSLVTFLTPNKGPFLNLEKYKKKNYLKDWTIKEVKIESREKIDNDYYYKETDSLINYSENVLDVKIIIKRNVNHYIFKIILPVFLILCIAWYVLWIPTRKYETRLNTSIIALLALIAYNFVFQDDIPKLNYLTDLDWYILLSYVFCCLPVFISIGSSKLGAENQKKIIKINKHIRKWGVLAYIFITFAIFKLI